MHFKLAHVQNLIIINWPFSCRCNFSKNYLGTESRVTSSKLTVSNSRGDLEVRKSRSYIWLIFCMKTLLVNHPPREPSPNSSVVSCQLCSAAALPKLQPAAPSPLLHNRQPPEFPKWGGLGVFCATPSSEGKALVDQSLFGVSFLVNQCFTPHELHGRIWKGECQVINPPKSVHKSQPPFGKKDDKTGTHN